ncbi:diol dehydratase small subunit [Pseudogemmobacter bohemicus]|uniref:diol dehydratase small subunit n=1 Tax=Pseudogemmobacter bohemicus TaxID=2250708 RepID=UPI000DD32D1A|nr:diol dehydratase small subunit [Pseudogemmobacter bohemicus]
MSRSPLDLYPLSEKASALVRTPGGLGLEDFTVDAALEGRIGPQDLAITPEVLRLQADIARAAGRDTLAANFERAAELTAVPQEMLLDTYELLRPGRAGAAAELRARAQLMRARFNAPLIAALIEEAAEIGEKRGLFTKRF